MQSKLPAILNTPISMNKAWKMQQLGLPLAGDIFKIPFG